MRKRRTQFIALLCLLLAGLSMIFLNRDVEPSYNGRTLSEWAISPFSNGAFESKEAADAIRQIGTNSLPFVLHWLMVEPSVWRDKVNNLPPRLRATRIARWISNDRQSELSEAARHILSILGP